MKIVKIYLENILKLKAVTIIPKSDIIEIKGQNGAGKSSLLKAIVMGFKGKKEFDDMPIRKGTKKGKIEIKIDGDSATGITPFTITETITDKTVNLAIKPESVLLGETPRSFLDKLIGRISFDPLAFINDDGPKQKKVLRELMGIEAEDSRLEAEEKRLYDERTAKCKELKLAEAKLEGLKQWPIKEIEEIKISELSNKLTKAIEFNQKITDRMTKNQTLKEAGIKDRERIETINKQISELQLELAEKEESLEKKRSTYAEERGALALIEKINIEDIKVEISEIELTNSKVRDNQKHADAIAAHYLLKEDHEILEGKIENCRNERIELLKNAQIPVPGLTFDEDGLLYNNIPLKQCSTGESIMVWLPIAMKLNPALRILLVKDASLLDNKNMQIIRDILKKEKSDGNEYQIFMEKMSNSPDGFGIFIEDGEVVCDSSCSNGGNGITVNSDDF